MLHLHHRALARLIRRVELLGDHAVEASAFEPGEPVLGDRAVRARWREVHRRPRLPKRALEHLAALRQRPLAQIVVA